MTKLSETESLDEFAIRFVNELGLDGKIKVQQASDLFQSGFLDFLRFAFDFEGGVYRSNVQFVRNQDWGFKIAGRYFPQSENVKTLVHYVTTPPNRRTEDDPLLLLVLRESKKFNISNVQRLANETFGKGAGWTTATPQDLEYLEMLPSACHAFPTIKDDRAVHLWLDANQDTTRHPIYLPSRNERAGFLLVEHGAYAEIMSKRVPRTFKVEKIAFQYN